MANKEDMWMIPEFPISWSDLNRLRDAFSNVDMLFKTKKNAEAKEFFNEKVVLIKKDKSKADFRKLEIQSILAIHLPVLDRVYDKYLKFLDKDKLYFDTDLGKPTLQLFYDFGY